MNMACTGRCDAKEFRNTYGVKPISYRVPYSICESDGISDGSPYKHGYKGCLSCMICMIHEGLWCPCCSRRLRSKSQTRTARFKRLNEVERIP